jgi:hypothetical protein
MVASLYQGMDMTKVMFGINAVQAPAWVVLQNQKENGTLIAGASRINIPLQYGTIKTHTLVVGELIVRPHLVIANDDFAGHGAGGFWTSPPTAKEWIENGDILVCQHIPDSFKAHVK